MAKKKAVELPSGERVMGTPPERSVFQKPPTQPPLSEIATAAGRRQAWEQSPAGQARTKPVEGLAHTEINYHQPEHVGPRHYDEQLPGMSDPNAAPRPPRWHELSETAQAHTRVALAAHGTSVEQMAQDLGTQYDQAVARAQPHGAMPWSENFYGAGEPRQVLDRSAKEIGISPLIHAQMNALTSPKTKFSQRVGKERTVVYPNDIGARHAMRWAQSGRDPTEISTDLATTGENTEHIAKYNGYQANLVRAAKSASQHLAGVAPADWVTGAAGQGPFDAAPKTGPYANAWSDTHPQFFVSDVHSGGGGALPHLSSETPTKKDPETGKTISKGKTEREQAIASIPFFHSAADEAARMAMAQRGIGHVREFQAAQWGEEQLQRGESARAMNLRASTYPSEKEVYRSSKAEGQGQHEQLFQQDVRGREHPHTEAIDVVRHSHDVRGKTAKDLGLEF